ncbi:Myb-related protein A (A-Myb) (Myb-like protein 1), partial [Durusdinium trenchii]
RAGGRVAADGPCAGLFGGSCSSGDGSSGGGKSAAPLRREIGSFSVFTRLRSATDPGDKITEVVQEPKNGAVVPVLERQRMEGAFESIAVKRELERDEEPEWLREPRKKQRLEQAHGASMAFPVQFSAGPSQSHGQFYMVWRPSETSPAGQFCEADSQASSAGQFCEADAGFAFGPTTPEAPFSSFARTHSMCSVETTAMPQDPDLKISIPVAKQAEDDEENRGHVSDSELSTFLKDVFTHEVFTHPTGPEQANKKIYFRRSWTPSEDAQLVALVKQFGKKRWSALAQHLPGKTGNQCSQRWHKALDPNIIKGKWTKAEDALLTSLVEKYGRRWKLVSNFVAGRTGKQCRDRYISRLNPNLRTGKWSDEEVRIVMEAHKKLGNRWAAIQKLVPHRGWYTIKWKVESLNKAAAAER